MIAGAFHLHRFVIKKKSLVRIKADRTNAKRRLFNVCGRSVTFDCGYEAIEIWSFKRP